MPSGESHSPPPSRRHASKHFRHGRVEVVFNWSGDRWVHRVAIAQPEGPASGWESVEGPVSPHLDPHWPASPPMVELMESTAQGRRVLLGVGLAGRSHFSASWAPHPLLSDTLLVEIACRIHAGPGWLGSTYRPLEEATPQPAVLQLAASTTGGKPHKSGRTGASPPRTVQWSYTISPQGIALVGPPATSAEPPENPR